MATVDVVQTIEAEFTGSVWTDITPDIVSVGVVSWKRGIWGNGPFDRIAGTGELTFILNNSANNSGGKLGYYSPEHANARSGFEIGLPIRVKCVYDLTTYYKFYGLMSSSKPDVGQYKNRYVNVTVLDYMNIMANYKLQQLQVQTNKRPDEVLTTVIAALPIAPLDTNYDADPDIYTRALHTERDESTTARTVAQKLAVSSYSHIFPIGDSTGGETLRYQDRHSRITDTTIALTLTNTMVNMSVERNVSKIYNTIKTTTFPVEINADATLYTSQREITVQPGLTTIFTANYTDENGAGRRLTGSENWVTLVGNTHYRASASEDGSENDLTDDCSVNMDWGSNSAVVEITNNAAVVMYVNLFFLAGDALLLYDPVIYETTDSASQLLHGDRVLDYQMPYHDNYNTGVDFGNHLLARHKDPIDEVVEVEYIGNTSDIFMTAAMEVEIGERIKLVEMVTGMSREYFINGIEQTKKKDILRIRYAVERASSDPAWRLGEVGYGELGDNTYLAF